jgi:predicted Fe-Mo cluster-binding NifX family protein
MTTGKGGSTVNDTLKIAVPTNGAGGLDAQRSAHFGHADSFTIVDVSEGQIVGDHAIVNPPHAHGGCGLTVSMLAQAGVGTAIVVGMGGGPLAAMNANGMTPLFDDQSPTPRAAVEAFMSGRLVGFGGEHTCQGH